jgi:5-carboxymethyl-2-hydroxymuconate isomerase
MIYNAPAGSFFAPAVGSVAEREATPAIYVGVPTSASPPPARFETNLIGEKSEFQQIKVPAIEQFNWQDSETNRDYIHLEQKVLAGKSTVEEASRYKIMKQDRNGIVFADRYVTDYAEIQRIQTLSIKIAELQKYLRPIKIG